MRTDFVLDALEQALYSRQPERSDALVHTKRQGLAIRLHPLQRAPGRIRRSAFCGSKGDSCENALAEISNGLYKAELIHRRAPWKTREAVERPRWNGCLGSITDHQRGTLRAGWIVLLYPGGVA